ncbi:MAG: NfeD family protein [Rhodothalassiaceae bacterium]
MTDYVFTPWMWFIIALILLFLELLAPGVVFLWIAIAAGATGIATLELQVLTPELQTILFAALSLLATWAGRRWFRPKANEGPAAVNRGAAAHVGRRVVVTSAIRNGEGRVKLGDSVWKAFGPEADEGEAVEITGVEGTAFHVRRLTGISGPGDESGEA